ncbi:MAG: hypothetical protein AAF192_00315 [Pseudomonadota bacterium]
MTVLQIWTTEKAQMGNGQFVLVETEFEDFAVAAKHVDEGGSVCGARLYTRSVSHMEQEVVRRHPSMIAAAAILRMELPGFRLVEGADR